MQTDNSVDQIRFFDSWKFHYPKIRNSHGCFLMQVLKNNYVHITETAVWQQISFKMASILQLPVFFFAISTPTVLFGSNDNNSVNVDFSTT